MLEAPGGHILCATLYAGDREWCAMCAVGDRGDALYASLCMLEAMEGVLCLLGLLEVMRCALELLDVVLYVLGVLEGAMYATLYAGGRGSCAPCAVDDGSDGPIPADTPNHKRKRSYVNELELQYEYL